MIPNDMNRIQLCIMMLPAGSAVSPGKPLPQQYSLLDAAQWIYASRQHFISGTGPRAWHPLG
jgi:hypothetical protein